MMLAKIFAILRPILSTKLPVWAFLVLTGLFLIIGGLLRRAPVLPGDGPARTDTVYVDRVFEVEKIKRVAIPQRVTIYKAETVRDTVVLVPTGLREFGVLPYRLGLPAIVQTKREITIPVVKDGRTVTYTYPIPVRPHRVLNAHLGVLGMSGYMSPTAGLSLNLDRFTGYVGAYMPDNDPWKTRLYWTVTGRVLR